MNTIKLKQAYRTSKNFYDGLLTGESLLGKLYLNFFWGGLDDNIIVEKVLSYIPDNFSGTLLDVPTGTAVFTHEKWRTLKNANITCLDYSEDMLNQAKLRLEGAKNVACVQGDVGKLPFEDNSCDIVFSMNGFHVFPDKNKAFSEVYRVLKPDGKFISTYYVKGENKRSDFLVKHFLVKGGWFNPPFQTINDVKSTLVQKYKNIKINKEGAFIYFCCEKKAGDNTRH